MANLIKFPYWECDKGENLKASSVDRDIFKKIGFSSVFQMEIAQIRKRFSVPFEYVDEPKTEYVLGLGIHNATTLEEAVQSLAYGHKLSNRWIGTLMRFVLHEEIILPKREEVVNLDTPILEGVLYQNDKLCLKIRMEKTLGEAARGGIVKQRLFLELEADTQQKDLTEAMKHIKRAQEKYLRRKEPRVRSERPYELLNLIKLCRVAGLSNNQIRERITKSGFSTGAYSDDEIGKMLSEAEVLGF